MAAFEGGRQRGTNGEHAYTNFLRLCLTKCCYVNGLICHFSSPLQAKQPQFICIFYFPYGYIYILFSSFFNVPFYFVLTINFGTWCESTSKHGWILRHSIYFGWPKHSNFSHTEILLKYSMLFHHYSNYHMLRSWSQQIHKFKIRTKILSSLYRRWWKFVLFSKALRLFWNSDEFWKFCPTFGCFDRYI